MTMYIIPIILGILGPLLFLTIAVGVIFLVIRKKQVGAGGEATPEHPIHFSEVASSFFSLAFLITNVVAIMTIVFSIIDKLLPDLLSRDNYYSLNNNNSELHTAVSLLVLTIPAGLILAYWMRKQKIAHKEEVDSPVRKFTIGTALVTTAITVGGSAFSIIYQFLEGDLSNRFLAKAASMLIASAALFAYYKLLYKKDALTAIPLQNIFAYSTTAIAIGLCVWSIAITGTPSQVRKEKFDDRRLSDLSQIQQQVLSYWQNHRALPLQLAALSDALSSFAVPTDPRTNTPYEYTVVKQSESQAGKLTEATFTFCANFETSRKATAKFEGLNAPSTAQNDISFKGGFDGYYYGSNSPFWDHPEGRHCFTRTIDPMMYPPVIEPKSLDAQQPVFQ